MISQKLKTIFYISIPLFIAHGLEEYVTGFYNIDPIFKFFFSYFDAMSIPQATFLLFQIMLWLTLILLALVITNAKWQLWLLGFVGLIYIFELHHFFEALRFGEYYPGMVTATAFPVIGFLFWKELIKNFKHQE
ncbi:MAG: HXXEE domain-containing protein [Parcubacteria group bacterium]|nr:HXXEE domain-containing protein [Parcubacteria group bacterium]